MKIFTFNYFSFVGSFRTAVLGGFAAVFLLTVPGCGERPSEYSEFHDKTTIMGTFVEIKAFSNSITPEKLKESVEGAFSLGRELEKKFSVYDPLSELNELNMSGKLKVSDEMFLVIDTAEKINKATGGAFDPTVAPILKKKGFYREMPKGLFDRIPSDTKGVGFDNVKINENIQEVILENGAWLDLSGIAKGYIVDRMAGLLQKAGIDNFLVNAGGDMYCGAGPRGGKWRIGIRAPGAEHFGGIIEVRDMAVATSGDYENILTDPEHSKTISHIIDPVSLSATETVPQGFTVLAPDCMTADAFATAMAVLGTLRAVLVADSQEDIEFIAFSPYAGAEGMTMSEGAAKYLSGEDK